MKNNQYRATLGWRRSSMLGLGLLLILGLSPANVAAIDSADKTLAKVYGSHLTACTATAVDSTNPNRVGPLTAGASYMIYGYTSASDFTGVAIKCLQGTVAVTVEAAEGVKMAGGEKQIWLVQGANTYISCQTGSGSGYYDVCMME